MADFGIVCEFNPLHKGHKYLIDRARSMGAERIVCVMSGNAVQRGELAVFDKYIRAEAAVTEGADLVLELPYPWCSASAEFFAGAAVKILSELCDTIIFGSECGDAELLERGAELADSGEFKEKYASLCADGEGSAKAYFDLLRQGAGYEFSSNDLLGIEYIRAIRRQGSSLRFVTVKREGAAYLDREVECGALPSATAIRELWRNGNFDAARKYIPEGAYGVFKSAADNGELTDESLLDAAAVSFFRLHSGTEIECFAEAGGGLGNRIVAAAHTVTSWESLTEAVGTKRYTDSRIRRAMLFAMTGVAEADLHEAPAYTQLLGASKAGRELMSAMRRREHLPIVTKGADAPRDCLQTAAAERLDSLFTLARERKKESSAIMKKTAYVEK